MKINVLIVLWMVVHTGLSAVLAQNTAEDYQEMSMYVYQRDLEGVKQKINEGTDVDITAGDSSPTPLIIACGRDDNDEVIEYLISQGADVNARGKYGRTPIIWAAGNSKDAVIMLLNEGADVRVSGNINGMTPMIEATFGYITGDVDLEVFEILAEHGADMNAALTSDDTQGYNPLMFAAINGKHKLIRFLVNHGARVDHTNAAGQTALMMAAREGDIISVKMLLNNNADPNIRANDGSTALLIAIEEGHEEVAEVLRDYGAK